MPTTDVPYRLGRIASGAWLIAQHVVHHLTRPYYTSVELIGYGWLWWSYIAHHHHINWWLFIFYSVAFSLASGIIRRLFGLRQIKR